MTEPSVMANEFSYAYVAIQRTVSTGNGCCIVQIGLLMHQSPVDGFREYCFAWANSAGSPIHAYQCDTVADHTYYYFQVSLDFDPNRNEYHYRIWDCGTGPGYGDCTSKNWAQDEFLHANAVAASETNHGADCGPVHIMGYSSDLQHTGKTGYPIAGLHHLGDPWGAKTLSYGQTPCAHYLGSGTDTVMTVYDDRNLS
jgi:hypothetical protein